MTVAPHLSNQLATPHSGGKPGREALLSIVIALHNEEQAIPALFSELSQIESQLDCRVEYICVNDGSTDGTLESLRAKKNETLNLTIVDLARNFGKEAAMTAGLAHARGDAILVIDADLQDPPSLIPEFVVKWRQGFDVVYGVRASRASDTLLKRTTAAMFYNVFNRVANTKIPHGAGDFRLMDRRVVKALLSLPERNRFMKGLFSWVGFRQTGVEYVRETRIAGRSSFNYPRLFNFAIDGLTSFSILPLRLASLAGMLVSIVGFAYAIFLIVRTLVQGVDVPGYASIMVVTMFLGGVQLLCLGFIGEYLGRLYVESKGRPLYIIAGIESSAPPENATSDESAGSRS
ncbi:MAG: glycosyltransferase family 2 protein [Rhizomicrobium sp.]|jgi:glycosyltransferase involved in cell wall biosynthesis